MDIAGFCLKNRVSTYVLTVVFLVGGVIAYQGLGRLEDPEFTIKDALIITPYPGASPEEVEQEVTEVIERAVQQLGQLDEVDSRSEFGLSTVTATIKDSYDKNTLPQVWDELRRKVNDAQGKLPPRAGPSTVNDDFGDVYGVFFAITGDGYSVLELEDYAKYLQRELLLVEDVAKVEIFGAQPEAIYVEILRERLNQFGISKDDIFAVLSDENLVTDSGEYQVATERVKLKPAGAFTSIDDFGNILISSAGASEQEGGTRLVYLRDVATISRELKSPPTELFRVNGESAVGVAISTAAGGNVVYMGEKLQERLAEIRNTLPIGMTLHPISIQSTAVSESIRGFVSSLLQAVVIVIAVLLVFMGPRPGVLIGFILLVTIIGTFIFMSMWGVMLERISLGALIIALGMLVDNAIVVTDGILVRLQKGEERLAAARAVVVQNQVPLLGATAIAVTAFAAVGLSQDSTGEFCRSLFQVILLSLMFSWVTAITITPLLCVDFLKAGKPGDNDKDPYDNSFYRNYKKFLVVCIRMRWIVIISSVAILFASLWGFTFIKQSFFPASTRTQFMVDFWLPEGSHISDSLSHAEEIEEYFLGLDGVTGVSSTVGRGMPRFILTYSAQRPNSAYSFFLVDVEDFKIIDDLILKTQRELEEMYPHSVPMVYKFALGPGDPTKIKFRFQGPETSVLRELASQAETIMKEDGNLVGIQTDIRNRVKSYEPVISEPQLRRNGLKRSDVARLLQEFETGRNVGVYREDDLLLPILARSPEKEHDQISDLENLQIYSPVAGRMIPLKQIVSSFETRMVDSITLREDRKRTVLVSSNPREGLASESLTRILPAIKGIELPPGYIMEIAGEYEDSKNAQSSLFGKIPPSLLLMILVTIFLFNSLKQPLIIWLCVPLAVVGVTFGLLVSGQPFGFMALLGVLSLSGMLIKNAIVLIDQTDMNIREGMDSLDAILDAGTSRMRPVLMAASTTVLGLLPLLFDAFFVSMAVTIMAGLTFASVLTLILVPVLYATVFKVKAR